MGSALEELCDEPGRVRSGLAAPGDEARRSPLDVGAVGSRHVRRFGRVSSSPVDPQVRGHPSVLVEDLHGMGSDPNVDLAAGQHVGTLYSACPVWMW